MLTHSSGRFNEEEPYRLVYILTISGSGALITMGEEGGFVTTKECDDGSHILHTAIAYFDVVLVEKGVILVLSREMFRYELKEGFADVSFHVAAERRVVPDNVTLAVSSWSGCLLMFVIGEACCVTAGFEGVVIGSLSFVKFVFVAGNV